MAARRRTGGFQRSSGGKTDWARVVPINSVIVAAGTKALLNIIVLANPGIMETIRRTRGVLAVSSDQFGIFESMSGAVGMMVVNDLALAAGAASIPGPVTDQSDDGWFMWQPFVQMGDQNDSAIGSVKYDFDSKAMRKVEDGFGVAVMVENASATSGLFVQLAFSVLTSRS